VAGERGGDEVGGKGRDAVRSGGVFVASGLGHGPGCGVCGQIVLLGDSSRPSSLAAGTVCQASLA